MKRILLPLLSLFMIHAYSQVYLSESFDDVTNLPGWNQINVSEGSGSTDWFQGNAAVFPSFSGDPTSYIGANFNNTSLSVISNWLITPVINVNDGDLVRFYTRTVTGSNFPDRLEVRFSDLGGASSDPISEFDVGSYTNLILEINSSLIVGGYPDTWQQQTATISGIANGTDVRVAFRYFVTDGGPTGNNSNYIGIDDVEVGAFLNDGDFVLDSIRYFYDRITKSLILDSTTPLNNVSIFNILGQKTMNVNLKSNYEQVDLSRLTAGVYLIQIEGDNNTFKTIKLAIE